LIVQFVGRLLDLAGSFRFADVSSFRERDIEL
jgi:hypothetical protein